MILTGGDERAADILVFDQTDAVGNAGSPGVAQSGIQTRIRDADDDVRIHTVGLGQNGACPHPRFVNADTLDGGVRAGKVDVLENTQPPGRGAAMAPVAVDAALVEGQNLAGKQIPFRHRAHSMEGAGFGGDHIGSVRHAAIAQGAEAMGVAHRDQLGGGHQHQREGALQLFRGAADGFLDGAGSNALPGDDIGDGFGVGGGVEDGPGQLQLLTQGQCVA